jgi:hypothetical protein
MGTAVVDSVDIVSNPEDGEIEASGPYSAPQAIM